MKYINAELLPSLFDEEYKGTLKMIEQGETHLNNIAEGFLEAYQVILKMPAADVRENVRGEWLDLDDDYSVYDCSVCDERAPLDIKWNFCPHCGADMRRGGANV